MAAKHKLYYSVCEGSISAEEIKTNLRSQGLKVVSVSLYSDGLGGVVVLQNKEYRDSLLAAGSLNFGKTRLTFMGHNPSGGIPPQKKGAGSGNPDPHPSTPRTENTHQMASKFFNPYHFVDVEGFTPRHAPVSHDRFREHCGRIVADLEFITPGFIPDPEKTSYIINDDTLVQKNENEDSTDRVHETIKNRLAENGRNEESLPVEILFDPDCRFRRTENADKQIMDPEEDSRKKKGFHKGWIFMDQEGRYFIKTREPNRRAHRVMDFFSIGDKPAIPSAGLKGMLRSTVETLSNSCFTGYGEEDRMETIFHRLDVQDDKDELKRLKAIILKRKNNGKWGYVVLDEAKILSPHLFNRIHGIGENALGAYWNRDG